MPLNHYHGFKEKAGFSYDLGHWNLVILVSILPLHDHILANIPSLMSQTDTCIGMKGLHLLLLVFLNVFIIILPVRWPLYPKCVATISRKDSVPAKVATIIIRMATLSEVYCTSILQNVMTNTA